MGGASHQIYFEALPVVRNEMKSLIDIANFLSWFIGTKFDDK